MNPRRVIEEPLKGLTWEDDQVCTERFHPRGRRNGDPCPMDMGLGLADEFMEIKVNIAETYWWEED